ncbi:MAG: hypothetical protein NVS3B5_20240 [Sphingomicrobium sp.]
MWVTDLRHFLDTNGTLVEGRARRIAIYPAEIMQAATLRALGGWSLSEVDADAVQDTSGARDA